LTDTERDKLWNSLSSTDWLNTLTRQANLSSYELNIRGGSNDFSYYFSLNNYDEEGISKGSTFNRKSGLINVEYSPISWFKLGNMTNISVAKNDQLRDRNNVQSPFRAMFSYNSYEPEKLANGDWNLTHQGFSISEAVLNNIESDITIGGVSNIYGEFKPMDDLKIKSTIGVNFRDFQREYYLRPGSILDQFVGDPAAPGSKTDNGNREINYVFSNTANYTKEINKNHRIDILAGIEYTEDNFKSFSLQSKGYPSDKVSTQNNGAAAVATTSNKFDWALFSLFGRAGYSFLDKYAIEASVRRDGSSRFGSQNRNGTFWSVGAGWNLAREKFMKSSQENILKIRAAVGTAGNFEIGNYPWQDLYALNVSYGDRTASAPSQLGNQELTWEKNFNWSTAVEYEFFKSRLKGYVEIYSKKTFDLIFTTPVSQTTGFATVLRNIGDIENKGIEANISFDVLRVPSKKMKLNVGLNFTYNSNKVTRLFNGKEVDGLGGITRLKEGYPVYNYYMPRWAGTDPDDGGHRWLDTSGNIVKTYSAGNSVILDGKSPDPTWYGNFRTSFEYQGFSISANLYYSGGNYIQNFIWSTLNSDGANARSAQAADALNYWKQKGDQNVNPKPILNGGQTNWTSDRFLQKGDFVRLRNVTIAYEIPEKALKSLKMKSLRVYFQGQNIWTLTREYKGDPEVGWGSGEGGASSTWGGIQSLFSYPQTLGFTGGIDVTF
jgi:TonB-linked SusC/RagA family outer membrane protein